MAQFATGAAHFPASVSPSPPSRPRAGGQATHQSGRSTLKAPPGGAPLVFGWPYFASCRLACAWDASLLTGAEAAASAFGTGCLRLLKATALHL